MNIPEAAVGAIAAALIGATMVLIGTILSKEQKTSEFRQAWVDALRNDLADYIGGVAELAAYATDRANYGKEKAIDFLTKNYDRLEKLESIHMRILLRLNPIEHERLITSLSTFLDNTIQEIQERKPRDDESSKWKDEIINESHRVLKEEWERVKKGEFAFRMVKYTSGTSIFFGMMFFTYYLAKEIFF